MVEEGWMVSYRYQSSCAGRDVALCFRPSEQTDTSGADAEATGCAKRIQTSPEADQSDLAASATLALGPPMDRLGPVKVKTQAELPQSSKTFRFITFHSTLRLTFTNT